MNDEKTNLEFEEDHYRSKQGRFKHRRHEFHGHHANNPRSTAIANCGDWIFQIRRAGL